MGLVLSSHKLEQNHILIVFLPSTINLWNDLPLHIRSLPTLSSFTNAIKHLFYRKTMKLFNHGNRCVNIIHYQLRNSVSNLNADLHRDFIRDNCICDNCGFILKMHITFSLSVHSTLKKGLHILTLYLIWVCKNLYL